MFAGFICACIPGAAPGFWICMFFENLFLGLCVYYLPLYLAKCMAILKTVHGTRHQREYKMYFTPADALSAHQTICMLRDDIKRFPTQAEI